MCIVADSVNDVSKTKIASFHIGYKINGAKDIIPGQLVIYSAEVDSLANTNAFILPVYNPGNDTNKIIPLDMSEQPDFFVDVENIFSRWYPKTYLKSQSLGFTNSFDAAPYLLPVHKVGDYKFSIMPAKADFDRINKKELNIDPAAKSAIDVHSDDYSFIVYQFYKKGKIEITPFGYICQPLRQNAMIIPTIHGHPHGNHPSMDLGYVKSIPYNYQWQTMSNNFSFENEAEFDHEIYAIIKINSNSIVQKKDLDDMTALVNKIVTDYQQRKIKLLVPKLFSPQKITLKGNNQNRNILIRPDGYLFIRDLTIDNDQSSFHSAQPLSRPILVEPSNVTSPINPPGTYSG